MRQLAGSLFIACMLAGCASTAAVVQNGAGTYTLSKDGTSSSAGLKTDAAQEASQYCAKNGRDALLLGAREERVDSMLPHSTTQIDFRCVATQQMRETTKAAVLECRDRRIHKEFKTYKQSAECSNPKILAAYEGANYPYMDLVRILLEARLVAAENLDKGAVTEAQAQTQSAELENRLATEDQKRRSAAAAFEPQQSQSDAGTYLQGLTAFQVTRHALAKRPAAHATVLACNTVGFGGGLSTTSCY